MSRRLREIATVLAIFLLVGMAQLPNLLGRGHGTPAADSIPPVALRVLLGVMASLPPALGARLALPSEVLDGLTGLLGLLLWTGLGLGVAWKLYLGGLERLPAVGTPSGARARGRSRLSRWASELLPPDLAALAGKQLRYILRSTAGRLGLLMSPVLGLIFAFMGRNAPAAILGVPTRDAIFLILCLMAAMYASELAANRFQWDRGGAALYFVAPVNPARVLLGLDIGLWLFGSLSAAGLLAAYLLVAGVPGPATVLSGLLLLAGARIVLATAGSVLSSLFPVPRDIGASRHRLALVPGLAMMGATSVSALLFGLPAMVLLRVHPAVAPLVVGVLATAAAVAYRTALPRMGALLHARREELLSALEGRPG